MIPADLINGTIELLAGFFVLNHCRVLYAHKQVRGVSLASVAFFTLWGIWNLYYYPALNQVLSFYGGLFVTSANVLYVWMIITYHVRSPRHTTITLSAEFEKFNAEMKKLNALLEEIYAERAK